MFPVRAGRVSGEMEKNVQGERVWCAIAIVGRTEILKDLKWTCSGSGCGIFEKREQGRNSTVFIEEGGTAG